ncbi:MAG: flavin reductase family protein [Rhodoblastus sp.]
MNASVHGEVAIDPRAFRNAVGLFATGVAIVTTRGLQGQAIGLTVNSFASVSLDPPLVLWSLARSSANRPHFLAAPGFAVHVLAQVHVLLAKRFASPVNERFHGLDVSAGGTGAPLLNDCAVRLECWRHDTVEAGDHDIFIGRVVHIATPDNSPTPLVFHRGAFVDFDSCVVVK